jgi:hypothetical protein
MLWWRVLAGETDEGLLECSIEELRVAMGSLDDLPEQGADDWGSILLILGGVRRRVEQGNCKVDWDKLGVGVLLSQGHGILHSLLGPVREVHAGVHDGGS